MGYSNCCDFDLNDNYMALLACIVSELTVDESVRKITLQHKRDQRKKQLKKVVEIKMVAKELMYLILKLEKYMNLIVEKKQLNNLE